MARVLLLCGPAFSGKTTLARALAGRGWCHLSPDDLLRMKGLEPGEGLPDAVWGDAVGEICSRIEALPAEQRDGVVDDTLCYRWLRDRYREAANRAGASTRLVALRIARSEVERRVAVNARERIRPGIRDAVLRAHLDAFEWPVASEGALEIEAGWSVERQIEAVERSW
jgi:predicted kinase